jgi:16S rRNA (cytosine967-C5)-methyltransferase
MHSHSYLNTVKKIVDSYDGTIPLASWLKQFFKADKKFGSRDRREISHACYCYYRLGNAFKDDSIEERTIKALFLCSISGNKILEELKSEWNEKVSLSVGEKTKLLSSENEIENIFPLPENVSKEVELQLFNQSFLIQPNLYLRIRPGKKEWVLQQLENKGIDFVLLNTDCIQLSNQLKIDEVLKVDQDVVIQDMNSQKTIEPLENSKRQTPNAKLFAWDCCAASGGKSILFHDHFPTSQLTVSDVRETILINLQKRFKRAGIESYDHFVGDVSSPKFSLNKKFDVIICDAPCSGSGTWSRTPEQLAFFKKEKIEYYSNLQKKIVGNASKALKKDGLFLYITCSVFKKENEEVVLYIQDHLSLHLKSMQYLKGYDKKADTLFVALFSPL